jgi:hypothetical protein
MAVWEDVIFPPCYTAVEKAETLVSAKLPRLTRNTFILVN